MTQTYHIKGMTCKGCKDSVIRAFQSLEGVNRVRIDLEKGTALVSMDTAIQTSLLKEALPSKFSLIEPCKHKTIYCMVQKKQQKSQSCSN